MKWLVYLNKILLSWPKGRFYRKSLIWVLVITCIPTITIGFGADLIGTYQIEKTIVASRQNEVALSAKRIDDYLSHLEKTVTQYASNPEYGIRLRALEATYDYEYIRDIFNSLLALKGSNPLIDQVNLYLVGSETIYSGESGVNAIRTEGEKDRFRVLLEQPRTAYWLPSFVTTGAKDGEEMPVLIYKLPVGSGHPFAALIVYINKSRMAQMIGESTADGQKGSFLIQSQGDWIVTAEGRSKPTKLEEAWRQAIPVNGQATETFVHSWEHETYSVSYSRMNRLGSAWIYVTGTSLSRLSAPVTLASRIIYGFSLLVLVTGIGISMIASNRLYRPIRLLTHTFRNHGHTDSGTELVDEIEFITNRWNILTEQSSLLDEQLQEQLPHLREGYLLQLMHKRLHTSDEEVLLKRMERLGWTVRNTSFTVLVIQWLGFNKTNDLHSQGSHEIMASAVVHAVTQLVKKRHEHSEMMNLQSGTVGILLMYPDFKSEKWIKEQMYQLADEVSSLVSSSFQLEVTASLGRVTFNVAQLPQVLEEAMGVLKFRDLTDTNQILDANHYTRQESVPIRYPFALETELIDAVRTAREKEAIELLESFCQELARHAGKQFLFQQGMLQLFGNLQFGFLKAGFPPPFQESAAELYEQLAQMKEPHEVIEWFSDCVIRPYIQEIREASQLQSNKLKDTVDQIIVLIQEKYNTEISLEMCAELYGIHALTLSKWFKKATGTTFIDYLTAIRLDKSKWLLANTNSKINDIAQLVGYQPTYFNRLFKRHEGLTPSQYRDKYKNV
ncbi:AraC family transcriptional regulator [Paenibacillus agricola]|uniref:Helix-turn-helix transcriptional regulator n=1 Tax=Paenibacillus agricola TaxID=2716264 RepID=A0ABX0JB58_9BACL|nr:AraC family transcriptional regulator [Paenibacillus agricola]NHN32506.1 helix-turn-helix transcriptional regulator [Paenibacillus agricola]